MKKSALAKKRRSDAVVAARDALRVLRSARSDVARIVRPWRAANKRLSKALLRLETLDEPSSTAGDTRELLDCLIGCLNDEADRVTDIMHRIQASQMSRDS